MNKIYSILLYAAVLSACSFNGALLPHSSRTFTSSPETKEQMKYDSARVQQTEREERKERRQERRELLMDEADAIKRANEGSVRVIHHHQLY